MVLLMGLALPGQAALAAPTADGAAVAVHMPYAQAGLTPKQAAAHLLGRFTFGARPGEVDAVVNQGLDKWFAEQLQGKQPDETLAERMAPLGALNLPDVEIAKTFLEPGQVRNMAKKDDMLQDKIPETPEERRAYALKLADYAHEKGYKLVPELMQELYAQKLLRAVYTKNQVREVLTDFWFNHFNVSRTNNQAKPHLLAYERDAIRPNVLTSFRKLLGATAKHPAMLFYLNNAESVAPKGAQRLVPLPRGLEKRYEGAESKLGLNENFARELMELHTLGVDGGYTQHDVEQVARAITGWTSYPRGPGVDRFLQRIDRAPASLGIVQQGSFYFMPFLHDAGRKTILGQNFPAGHGLDEGERVLDLLASEPATARFLARKLATRFVGDHPDEKLVKRLAQRYLATHGDLTKEYIAIVESPEFWATAGRRSKVKTAFEYVVSSIRTLDGNLTDRGNGRLPYARSLTQWMDKMGQPIYGYQAPTGFPDRAEIWVSSGSIVNRINFAFALVTHRLAGVTIDNDPLLSLQGTPLDHRVATLAADVLPGRDTAETIKMVKQNIDNPEFLRRIETTVSPKGEAGNGESDMMMAQADAPPSKPVAKARPKRMNPRQDFSETEKIVGILISSPEFQRR